MDYRVILSKPSLRDLGRIARYIAQDNPPAAERVGLELVRLAESLQALPARGAPRHPAAGERSLSRALSHRRAVPRRQRAALLARQAESRGAVARLSAKRASVPATNPAAWRRRPRPPSCRFFCRRSSGESRAGKTPLPLKLVSGVGASAVPSRVSRDFRAPSKRDQITTEY